jgi:thioredoxin-like negative regulator of GroEL
MLMDSVTEKSGAKSKIKPPPPSAAVEVSASNFDDVVLNNNKDVLVAFTAPWVCPQPSCLYLMMLTNSADTARQVVDAETQE